MRTLLNACLLCAVVVAIACNPAATTNNANAPANTNGTTASAPAPPAQTNVPPISSAHGNGPAQPSTAASANEQPEGVDTKALDAKIEKLEAKVKAGGGSATDKKALANAYLERGNIYYNAGNPRLYKFALGDLRRALRYDPENAEAKEKVDELIRIYNSLGRPVPTNGLEP